ncbi:ATP-binding protein [Roseivirga sp. BDSF3-8]|uniref:ATP-binding protein n=1 Tax=Roseivirga sp. BDSF3-8 TaxID=3241598 RepID=UPI003531F13B
MRKPERLPEHTAKNKVILWFMVAFVMLAVAGVIAYTSFNRLEDSVERLAAPNNKLIQLNRILADISRLEYNSNQFLRDFDTTYLQTHRQKTEELQSKLTDMYDMLASQPVQQERLDSISLLLGERMKKMEDLTALRSQYENEVFTEKAFREISRRVAKNKQTQQDSAYVLRHITTEVKVEDAEPKPESAEKEEKENKGFFRNIGSFFTKKSNEEDAEEERANEKQQVRKKVRTVTDTIALAKKDTVLQDIQKILSGFTQDELRYRRLLEVRETDLVQTNAKIVDKIQTIISEVEEDEIVRAVTNSKEAKNIAQSSTRTIAVILGVFFFTSLLFVSLISGDIRKSIFYRQQLVRAKEESERLARVKEEFLANMSHEIRTPLNAIVGFTEQLEKSGVQHAQQPYIDALKHSSGHLLHLVNDILDYSKIEAGELPLEEIPFYIKSVVHQVFLSLENKARQKGLNFYYEVDERLGQAFLGDPHRLAQILINLAGNAIKFTNNGEVFIDCKLIKESEKKMRVRLDVKDTGAGISSGSLKNIFDSFKQADSTVSRKYGGTGLGLAITKRLVEMHDGRIKVTSEVGKGSTFTLEIPYQKTDMPVETTETVFTEASEASLEGKRLLGVDDDAFNLKLLRVILDKYKLDYKLVNNGADAIRLANEEDWDLMLLDMQMPEVSGVEVVRAIRGMKDTKRRAVPVVALTANVLKKDLQLMYNEGANDHLLKPYKETELVEKLLLYMGEVPLTEKARHRAGNMDDREKANAPANDKLPVYDLNDLKRFTGDDPEAIREIVEDFIEETEENLRELIRVLERGDVPGLKNISHKMFPGYSHFNIHPAAELLREIETDVENKKLTSDMKAKTEKVIIHTERVLAILREDYAVV